jgi:hypothetical protein
MIVIDSCSLSKADLEELDPNLLIANFMEQNPL